VVAATYGWADPELVDLLEEDPSDDNRAKGEVERRALKTTWDLFSLGKTLLQWIGIDPHSGKDLEQYLSLTPYTRKYLLLVAARLIGSRSDAWLEERVGLARSVLAETAIIETETALRDVRKLSGAYSLLAAVPEFDPHHPSTLQIGADEALTFTPRLADLLQHPALRRLGSITQLGLINQVYPTATHMRLEHSLGTLHNCSRFVASLVTDAFSPFFAQIMEAEDIAALLVTALVHDIGQFPLAHDLEELAPGLFDHKALTIAILRGERSLKKAGTRRIPLQQWDELLEPWGIDHERVIQILEAKPNRQDSSVKDRILRSIIDGPVDADKLDYLLRDSARLGVPYGLGIDTDRILRSLTVILESRGSNFTLASVGVHEKSKVAAEFVAIARYAMFAQVYWQHSVRSMKAMLGRAILKLVNSMSSERERNEFRTAFEELVLSLPASLYPDRADPDAMRLFSEGEHHPTPAEAVPRAMAGVEGTLAATDAAVLFFLEAWLSERETPEAELIRDLMGRRIYKRLFVYSLERSPDEGALLMDEWDKATPLRKDRVYRWLEQQIAERVDDRASSPARTTTTAPTRDVAGRLTQRVNANRPILLIDVPGPRSGSEVPLYFVLETQRRALRRDTKAVGNAEISEIWQEFGQNLRSRAGKVRIFCHPGFVDAVEASVDRDEFMKLFKEAIKRHR
jgi:HD superfamily phosphohydrolase